MNNKKMTKMRGRLIEFLLERPTDFVDKFWRGCRKKHGDKYTDEVIADLFSAQQCLPNLNYNPYTFRFSVIGVGK